MRGAVAQGAPVERGEQAQRHPRQPRPRVDRAGGVHHGIGRDDDRLQGVGDLGLGGGAMCRVGDKRGQGGVDIVLRRVGEGR